MPSADRKVLLRLPPGLLARVDEACGGMSRNAWLVAVIGEKVDGLLDPSVVSRCYRDDTPVAAEGEGDDGR